MRPSQARARRFQLKRIVSFLVVVAVIGAILGLAGRWLVHTAKVKHPDAVLVLSGFGHGERAAVGAKVFRRSGAERLVVFTDGPTDVKVSRASRFLAARHVPERAVRVIGPVDSTLDEAGFAAAMAKRCRWRSVAVVTSPYDTRRAGFLFRRALGERTVGLVSAAEPFHEGSWFLHLEDAEAVASEWLKLVIASPSAINPPDPQNPGTPC